MNIARVCLCGRDILPSDLQYLTDENIEEIGAALTHVERMRLQAALQAQRGVHLPDHHAWLATSADMHSCLVVAEDSQTAGTE